MAIRTENVIIRGVSFVHTYSDAGHKIKQAETGYLYEDAYDPIGANRAYTESDEYINTHGATTAEEVAKLKATTAEQSKQIETTAQAVQDMIIQLMGGDS